MCRLRVEQPLGRRDAAGDTVRVASLRRARDLQQAALRARGRRLEHVSLPTSFYNHGVTMRIHSNVAFSFQFSTCYNSGSQKLQKLILTEFVLAHAQLHVACTQHPAVVFQRHQHVRDADGSPALPCRPAQQPAETSRTHPARGARARVPLLGYATENCCFFLLRIILSSYILCLGAARLYCICFV